MKNAVKNVFAGLTGATMAACVSPLAAMAATPADSSTGAPSDGASVQAVENVPVPGAGCNAVHNVQGSFSFNQNEVTPSDDLFNIFGATVESMCAKPTIASAVNNGVANYYVNVGGDIKKAYTVNIADMSDQAVRDVLVCSCATGGTLAQAVVVGVPIEKVICMAELEDGVNTFTAVGADGYGVPMPLQYVLDNKAMLVYEMNGDTVAAGTTQLWMPKTVAAYFTRDVVSLRLTKEDTVPTVNVTDSEHRGKVEIVNTSDTALFHTGDAITFKGHADDLGSPIVALEVSLDGGQTWTVCSTDGATADRWISWEFTTQIDEPGVYEFTVRAITEDGVISPIAATTRFTVE